MNAALKTTLAVVGAAFATQAAAEVTFYERDDFSGRFFTTDTPVANFDRYGFNDRASSVVVARDTWEICEDVRFGGRCVVLRPGRYPSLVAMGLDNRISSVRNVTQESYVPPPNAQITFYEREGFGGRSFTADRPVGNFERFGFNDRASSVEVVGARWEVCDDLRFQGRCVLLNPGRYPSLSTMGLNNRVTSARIANSNNYMYTPAPVTGYDYRRRDNERLYEVDVSAVRAVVGTPEQRCWVERERFVGERTNVPGAIAGAVIGGILGHQVGGGRGRDVATVGGAVAGAAVGGSLGRDESRVYSQEVQRCANVPSQARPDYWDVIYTFRGQEHHIQMSTPPGRTITVNEQGEPRA